MNGMTNPKLTEQTHPINDNRVENLGKINATNWYIYIYIYRNIWNE